MRGQLIGTTIQAVLLFAVGLWFLLGGAEVIPIAGRGPLVAFVTLVFFFSSSVVSLLWSLHRRVEELEQQKTTHRAGVGAAQATAAEPAAAPGPARDSGS